MLKLEKVLIESYILGVFLISLPVFSQKTEAEKIAAAQKIENLRQDKQRRVPGEIKKLKAEIKKLEAQYKSAKNKRTADRRKNLKLAKTLEDKKSQLAKLKLHLQKDHVKDKFGESYRVKIHNQFIMNFTRAGCYTTLPGKIINADFQGGFINSGESLFKRGFTWVSLSGEVKEILNKHFGSYFQGSMSLAEVKTGIYIKNKKESMQLTKDISSALRKTMRQLFPGKKVASKKIKIPSVNIREVRGERSMASFPVVHNDFIAARSLLSEYNEVKDRGWQMVNIWVALKDIKSHPLAMVTNPNWPNNKPPMNFMEGSLEQKSRMLCANTEHLNYIIKDMKAFDAIIFLTKDVFHTALTAGDISETRASFEFRSFIKVK